MHSAVSSPQAPQLFRRGSVRPLAFRIYLCRQAPSRACGGRLSGIGSVFTQALFQRPKALGVTFDVEDPPWAITVVSPNHLRKLPLQPLPQPFQIPSSFIQLPQCFPMPYK